MSNSVLDMSLIRLVGKLETLTELAIKYLEKKLNEDG